MKLDKQTPNSSWQELEDVIWEEIKTVVVTAVEVDRDRKSYTEATMKEKVERDLNDCFKTIKKNVEAELDRQRAESFIAGAEVMGERLNKSLKYQAGRISPEELKTPEQQIEYVLTEIKNETR